MADFDLDPAFVANAHKVADLPLCQVRLHDDARYPWLVLIPAVPGARELADLAQGERDVLMEEILRAGGAVRAIGEALGRPISKLNVGQLGNVTPQLHLHVIGRRNDDAAWPAPVWGSGTPVAYGSADLAAAVASARLSLGL